MHWQRGIPHRKERSTHPLPERKVLPLNAVWISHMERPQSPITTHYPTKVQKTGFCMPAWNFIWRQAEPIRSGSICTVSDIRFWATHYTARKIPSGWNIRHFTPTLWNSCILSPEKNFIFQNRSPGKSITTSSLRIDVRPGIMIEKNVEDLNQTVLPRSFLLNTR